MHKGERSRSLSGRERHREGCQADGAGVKDVEV